MDREYQGGGYGGGYGGGGGGYDGPHRRPFGRSQSITKHSTPQISLLKFTLYTRMTKTNIRIGPVTDYTSSMVVWMRHRQPRYKGGGRMEMERPSPSYTVDVRSSKSIQASIDPHKC